MPQPSPTPPGQRITEALNERDWKQQDLAFTLGISSSLVSNLISGRKSITAADSVALGAAFNLPPEHFLDIQSQFDLFQTPAVPEDVQHRAKVQRQYPLRDMIKRGWVEDDEGASRSVSERVAAFFGVSDLEQVPLIGHAARRTHPNEELEPAQVAWLHRVRKLASEMAAPHYSPERLQEAVAEMESMRPTPALIRHVPRTLESTGLRFLVVEGLPGGKIDGVCMWLDDASPVVAMSLRLDRIDNFWFVLRHEIEHVLNGDGKEHPVVDTDLGFGKDDETEIERLANDAASDFCVPSKKMDSFFARKNPLFSRRDIEAFSRRVNTHPGLVVGQLQHRLQKWSFLRDLQVKVKDHVVATALTDGWGDVIPVYS